MEESLIQLGSAVKATAEGRVEGYLVLFSTERDPDISSAKDFFTKETDYDFEEGKKSTIYYAHGFDKTLQRRRLGQGTLSLKDAGVWIEGQLALRDEYERKILELAKAGKLGWSSGTAAHLVERERAGDAHRVKSWPLGLDASLTPTPAEPRTQALSLKSYLETLGDDFPLAGKSYAEELLGVLAAVEGGVTRTRSLRDIRVKEGRQLSSANRERLTTLRSRMGELQAELDELLESTQPLASQEEVAGVVARYQLLRMEAGTGV